MRRPGIVAVAAVTVVALGSCSRMGPSDGPTLTICGQRIGEARQLNHPWYQDASGSSVAVTLPYIAADPQSSGTWLRVSQDCKRGAHIANSRPAIINFSDSIRSMDGNYAAIRVSPKTLGSAAITVTNTRTASHQVTFSVVPPASPTK